MYHVREYQHTSAVLSDLLTWGGLIAGPSPTVCQNKDGLLMASLAYQGEDVAMLGQDERLLYLHRLNLLLKRLGTGWALWADEWHEPATAYPARTWRNATACFVDASRRALFTSGGLHESQQYLTLCWQPPSRVQHRWFEGVFTTHAKATTRQEDATRTLESFLHALGRWSDGLTGLLPAWHWLSPDDTLTYLHRCISWQRHTVGLPDVPLFLDGLLSDSDFLPGHTPQLGRLVPHSDPPRLEKYLRPICVKSWPKSDPDTGAGGLGIYLPSALQQLPFPYRFTVRWIALDKTDAKKALEDYQAKWTQLLWSPVQYLGAIFTHTELNERDPDAKVNETAKDHSDSITRALRLLQTDAVGYGALTPTVLVWGESLDELAHREREVVKTLQAHDMIAVGETYNAPQAWLGTLPGDVYHNSARRPPLPSLALAFLLPHATCWAGPARDEHFKAPPLLSTSSDGVPLRFALHPEGSESGNTMLLGPTRTGKSGALGLLMSQFLGYDGAQVFCFDKDYALYIATCLHGGTHYDLGGRGSVGLQPLGHVDDGEAEQRWALHWLTEVLRSQGCVIGPDDTGQLWDALTRLARMPPGLRTLTTYTTLLQVQRLKSALAPFCRGGAYRFLDADQDTLTWSIWTTIEMRHLLALPAALPHVLRVLFHRLGARFDGRPTLIVLDEVRKLLADEVFAPEILDFLKERAKVNVSVVLCTQEIVDFSDSAAAQAIWGSVTSWLYLPNRGATKPTVAQFYRDCGLSDSHIQLLAMSRVKQDYLYVSDGRTRRFQLTLSPLERLLVAASTPDEIAAFTALAQESRKEPLTAAWLRMHGYGLEADVYTTTYAEKA